MTVKFGGVKSYTQEFGWQGGAGDPSPHVVQGYTVSASETQASVVVEVRDGREGSNFTEPLM